MSYSLYSILARPFRADQLPPICRTPIAINPNVLRFPGARNRAKSLALRTIPNRFAGADSLKSAAYTPSAGASRHESNTRLLAFRKFSCRRTSASHSGRLHAYRMWIDGPTSALVNGPTCEAHMTGGEETRLRTHLISSISLPLTEMSHLMCKAPESCTLRANNHWHEALGIMKWTVGIT